MKTDPHDSLTSDNTQLSTITRVWSERTLSPKAASVLQSIAPMVNVVTLIESASSQNTRRAYRCDLEDFARFGGSIPSTPTFIAQYIAFRASSHRPATIRRRVAAIGRAHRAMGLDDPCANDLVRTVLRGVRRRLGVDQRQAAPLLREDLASIVPTSSDLRSIRNRALMLLGFAGAFRRSELVALEVGDLSFPPEGVLVQLRRSKTDQEGMGRQVAIPFGRSQLCAVRATRIWLERSGLTEGPLFVPIGRSGIPSKAPLRAGSVNEIVKRSVKAAGFDPSKYSGHSLRAGLITSAAQAGVSLQKIMDQSGHRSVQMLTRYIRDANLFVSNAAGAVL